MQNDMRDRLIKLLKTPNKSAILRKANPQFVTEETDEESIVADYLIANGVIVPPCKVGDTVYDVVLCDDNIYRICKMKITGMSIFGELYVGKTIPPFIWNLYLTDKYSYAYRTFSDIGKTVFLTKGQAEMKLRELNK